MIVLAVAIAAAASLLVAESSVTVLIVVMFVLILNWLYLITRVSDDNLYVRLGIILPIGWKRIRIDEILEIRCVQYRPLRDAGGWGIRFGRFDGSLCRFYNARGNRGVFIRTARRNYIIGSQSPEQLHDALTAATSSPSSTSPS